MKGKDRPLFGNALVTTPILMKACNPIRKVMPEASNLPKPSGALSAMHTPQTTKAANAASTSNVATRPSSYPITENMKSV